MEKKKSKHKNKSKYEENLSVLAHEVAYFKHINFKKETKKVIKTKHFLKYFKSHQNSFLNTPLDLVWPLNNLTNQFLADIAELEYEEIIPLILQLLCGDFKNTIKKKKLVDLRKENQKLCSFYLLPLSKTKNKNILFALCLKGIKYSSSTINLLSISTNWEFENIALKFLDELNKDENYPIVEFDKNGIYLVDEILFSHKEKEILSGSIICYPLKNLNLENNNIFYSKTVNKKLEILSNDSNDFLDNELNMSIINQIENNQYETLIISAIEGEFWDYKLSLQEKTYVKNSDTFILSGRPGTGKTTVILFKLFSIYFNYILKKNHRLIDLKYINNIDFNFKKGYKGKDINKSLRIVFTSLSQDLCERQQNIFEQSMVRKIEEIYKLYKPISKSVLRSISSFRKLNEYPLFANFRKILFMIDGSLTFQFFSRHNLTTYEGNHDTEYNYIKDYEYEVNKYSYNSNDNYINFFYRSPHFLNAVQNLKEANESTFIKFYNNFLTKKNLNLVKTIHALNLNPLEIYAQLISVIKGSYTSHLYMNNCISKEEYKTKGRKITDLPNLDEIYDICMI